MIHLSQTAFIDRVLEHFGQKDAHPTDTPMVQGVRIERPDHSCEHSDKSIPYQELVGSLMYIANATRPDIVFAIGRLASVMDCYTTEHWKAAICVLCYLKGTRNLSLRLGGTHDLSLTGFSDSDYANCTQTSRSVGRYCFNLGTGTILWRSHKQQTVADSLCYAEYIALSDVSHEAMFLRMLLKGINFLPPTPPLIHCDNDAAVRLAEDQVWHSKVKHIHVKYHYVREQVLQKRMKVTRVHTKDNMADLFTKALSRPDFLRHHASLGLRAPAGEEDTKALLLTAQLTPLSINTYHTLYTYHHNNYDTTTTCYDTDTPTSYNTTI
jgi:hypothetical protein